MSGSQEAVLTAAVAAAAPGFTDMMGHAFLDTACTRDVPGSATHGYIVGIVLNGRLGKWLVSSR